MTTATRGVTDLVEAVHHTIAGGPSVLGRPFEGVARALTAPVYATVRGVAGVVGEQLDAALAQLEPLLGDAAPAAERGALLSALNGVLGDYLEETKNPLAIGMQLRAGGAALTLDREALRRALPNAGTKILVLVHGSCMSDLSWTRNGHDHGAALARDLGYTPVYLHYNTGRHVSTNGRELAGLLEELLAAWPADGAELTLLTHSMGGLVARSACHVAEEEGLLWRTKLRAVVFLGTPHHGAPLERGGSWLETLLGVTRYSAPFARLGRLRSAGVTDLRFGYTRDEDWEGRERFGAGPDTRTELELPDGVACFAVAASTSAGPSDAPRGDGLVPVASALGRHEAGALTLRFPDEHRFIAFGLKHLDLLGSQEVYAKLRTWLAA